MTVRHRAHAFLLGVCIRQNELSLGRCPVKRPTGVEASLAASGKKRISHGGSRTTTLSTAGVQRVGTAKIAML